MEVIVHLSILYRYQEVKLIIGSETYIVDSGGVFGALLTDLSKAFDCIPHDLIIAKLEAYGFQIESLRLIYDYLSNRKQRVKINESYSSWSDIEYGVPQGSILGPLLLTYIFVIFFTSLKILILQIMQMIPLYILYKKIRSLLLIHWRHHL